MIKRIYILLFLLFGVTSLYSQIYPVNNIVQLSPPYSVYLPDYASEGRLRVMLTQRDLTEANYSLYIKIEIKLNGKTIMFTAPEYKPHPFNIQPGQPIVLTGTDLIPYLDSKNLVFTGYSRNEYEKNKSLPEGSYELCVTAYDYYRPEVVVSQTHCANYYLVKAEPPLLNQPACGSLIPANNTPILFQWMPMNTGSLNAGASTEYTFELFEVRPKGENPEVVAKSTNPVFTSTINQTQFLYTAANPMLYEDMSYVWRVKAADPEGRDAFRNKGYSKVCFFSYGGDPSYIDESQQAVQNLKAENIGQRSGKAEWDKGSFEPYRFYYRKPGNNNEWFPVETSEITVRLDNLEPNTEYECKVQGKIGMLHGPYSKTVTFRTDKLEEFDCSKPGGTKKEKGDPIENLNVGKILSSWDFDIKITEITSKGSGWYKGEGVAFIPFLYNYGVQVYFDNIYVNTKNQITDGVIYSKSRDREEWIKEQLASQGVVNKGDIIPDNTIETTIDPEKGVVIKDPQTGKPVNPEQLKPNEKGEVEGPFVIEIVDENGNPKQITVEKLPATIIDDNGKGDLYTINKDGSITKTGESASKSNIPDDSFTQINFGNARVDFEPADKKNNAFDEYRKEYKGAYLKNFVSLDRKTINTSEYIVPFMAMEAGKTAKLTAKLQLTNKLANEKGKTELTKNDVIFVTGKKVKLLPSKIGESNGIYEFTLDLPSGEAKDGLEVFAMVQMEESNPYVIGKITVLCYQPITYDVGIVFQDRNTKDITNLVTQVNAIYKPLGVSFNFTPITTTIDSKVWDLDGNKKMKVKGSGAFSSYTDEMKALNSAFRNTDHYNSEHAYLFMLDKADSSTLGDMPRGSQFGYIFSKKTDNIGQLVAHELGHGIFTLGHSWNYLGDATKNATDNLMDYAGGSHLNKYQWDEIHAPGKRINWFTKDEEGMKIELDNLNHLKELSKNGYYTFFTPDGKCVKLSEKVQSVYFSTAEYLKIKETNKIVKDYFPLGVLGEFRLNNKVYYATYAKDKFEGYFHYPDSDVTNREKYITEFTTCTEAIAVYIAKENLEEACYAGFFNKADDITNSIVDLNIEELTQAVDKLELESKAKNQILIKIPDVSYTLRKEYRELDKTVLREEHVEFNPECYSELKSHLSETLINATKEGKSIIVHDSDPSFGELKYSFIDIRDRLKVFSEEVKDKIFIVHIANSSCDIPSDTLKVLSKRILDENKSSIGDKKLIYMTIPFWDKEIIHKSRKKEKGATYGVSIVSNIESLSTIHNHINRGNNVVSEIVNVYSQIPKPRCEYTHYISGAEDNAFSIIHDTIKTENVVGFPNIYDYRLFVDERIDGKLSLENEKFWTRIMFGVMAGDKNFPAQPEMVDYNTEKLNELKAQVKYFYKNNPTPDYKIIRHGILESSLPKNNNPIRYTSWYLSSLNHIYFVSVFKSGPSGDIFITGRNQGLGDKILKTLDDSGLVLSVIGGDVITDIASVFVASYYREYADAGIYLAGAITPFAGGGILKKGVNITQDAVKGLKKGTHTIVREGENYVVRKSIKGIDEMPIVIKRNINIKQPVNYNIKQSGEVATFYENEVLLGTLKKEVKGNNALIYKFEGEELLVLDYNNFARLQGGVLYLDFNFEGATGIGIGGKVMEDIMGYYSTNVKGIKGQWLAAPDLYEKGISDNLIKFREVLKETNDPVKAAFATQTGKWAAKYNYNKVEFIGEISIESQSIEVIFKK